MPRKRSLIRHLLIKSEVSWGWVGSKPPRSLASDSVDFWRNFAREEEISPVSHPPLKTGFLTATCFDVGTFYGSPYAMVTL